MTNEQLSKKISLALSHLRKASLITSKCAKSIAKDKGFKNWRMFDANITPNGQTIVNFNGFCSLADMDLIVMIELTKEEIIYELNLWDVFDKCDEETLELMKE